MRLYAVLPAVIALLQRERKVTYWALKHDFGFDDGFLALIRDELIFKDLARDEQSKGLMRESMTSTLAMGTELLHPYHLAIIAEVLEQQDAWDDGACLISEALELVHPMKGYWWEPELHRLRGEVLVPVYDWFTEGFDTEDLLSASRLLDAYRASGAV